MTFLAANQPYPGYAVTVVRRHGKRGTLSPPRRLRHRSRKDTVPARSAGGGGVSTRNSNSKITGRRIRGQSVLPR